MKGENKMRNKKNKMDPIGNVVRYGSSSTKWTLLFAVIAVFSVVAISFTQTSFALPDTAPASFYSTANGTEGQLSSLKFNDGTGVTPYIAYATQDDQTNKNKTAVFCLQPWLGFSTDKTYTKTSTDYTNIGVINIINYAYSSYYSATTLDDAQQATVQAAVWTYLQKTDTTFQSSYTGTTTYDNVATTDTTNGPVIKTLVDYGLNNSTAVSPVINFSMSDSDFELSADGNYMVSKNITVSGTPADNLSGITLALDSAPDGTIITEISNGNENDITDLSTHTFSNGAIIKIKVPKDKLDANNKSFNLTATATFKDMLTGHEYTTGDSQYQNVVIVTKENKTATVTQNFNVSYKVSVPNTGKNSSLALYIIGLIVLLSGIGVIYANVKPVNVKK